MNCCSLPHHVHGVCDKCPNREECDFKVILEMNEILDKANVPPNQRKGTSDYIGDSID